MFVCSKSSNMQRNACRCASDLLSVDAKYCSA